MDTPNAPAPHVAVLVTTNPSADLRDEFAQTLENAAKSSVSLRELASERDEFAVEVALPPVGTDTAGALQKTLEKTFGRVADVAVLPERRRRKRLLVSDMDSTIIAVECLDELADFAGKKDEVSAITERAMAGELQFEAALKERVAMLAGLPLADLEACFDQRIAMSSGAADLVDAFQKAGGRTVLVSGGFTYFTSRVADQLGFDDHRGNTLLDDGTHLTGAVGEPILGREAKLEALRDEANALGINVSETLTLGDGANDLAMIKASGLGIAYRAKPIVAAEAHCAINTTSLRTALYFQGFTADELRAP